MFKNSEDGGGGLELGKLRDSGGERGEGGKKLLLLPPSPSLKSSFFRGACSGSIESPSS